MSANAIETIRMSFVIMIVQSLKLKNKNKNKLPHFRQQRAKYETAGVAFLPVALNDILNLSNITNLSITSPYARIMNHL